MHTVKRTFVRRTIPLAALSALQLFAVSSSRAQAVPAAPPVNNDATAEETVTLSPFLIVSEKDDGYKATSTLAGTRVRTDLRDVASATTVVTKKFLTDTGVTKQEDLLVYTTNTEIGGLYGNFGGMGNTNGVSERSVLLRPSGDNRVRGLDAADNTRDYFQTDIPWDSYIVDRVDMQRGPNSILFGLGSPAGLFNTSNNIARFKNAGQVENKIGSFGTLRNSIDVNHVLIKDQLAFRLDAVDDDTKFRQEPAFNHDKRLFGTLRWDPTLFSGGAGRTSIRANYEHGDIKANRPRSLAPMDKISTFFSGLNKQTWDPYRAWQTVVPQNSTSPASSWNPYVDYYMARLGSSDPVFWYDGTTGTLSRVQQSNPNTAFGLNSKGATDAAIGGFPFGRPIGVAGYNQYTKSAHAIDAKQFLGADKNYYKDKALTDTSVYDFYNNLLDGPNKKEGQKWNAYNLNLSQTFLNNRLAFEFALDHQDYRDGQQAMLNDTPAISVDINSYLIDYPAAYGAGTAIANPNVGRAYVGGSSHYGNSSRQIVRDSYRLTATGELRAEDFLGRSNLSELLGRHVFTALGSKDITKKDTRNYVLYGTDTNWALSQGMSTSISDGARQVDWIAYLSGDLRTRTSASGANISRIQAGLVPQSSVVRFFDSNWKFSLNPSDPKYVDPGAVWTDPNSGNASTQSENPANYVGWTNRPVTILNANAGDINQLYTDASKLKNTINTGSFTWQGYLWDGTIVPTFGWRRDKVNLKSGNAPVDPITKVASMNYDVAGTGDDLTATSKSWGVVVHTPKRLKERLPAHTDISLTYFRGNNSTPEVRVGFEGQRLPVSRGRTDDYGIAISTLDDRLTFKVNHYKTNVYDANLSGDSATSTLGSNTYYLYLLESWGTGSAATDALGMQGKVPGWEWYWSWAEVDHGFNGGYTDPTSAAFLNDPSTIKEKAAIANWIATMPSQSFFDAYGMPVNVAKLKAGDYTGGLPGWNPYNGVGSIQAAGAGKINGLFPVGTIDSQSEGYEFELTGRPIKNWDITMNASKTDASRTKLSTQLASFIERTQSRFAGAAGDLRLWWGGDKTIRQYYLENIWAAYQFQLESNGARAAELRPWHFNVTNNYKFDEGKLKGTKIGFSYRWDNQQILGYGLTNTTSTVGGVTTTDTKMDVNKPLYSKSENHVDFWVGYERKLTSKLNWSIQLNLRNVGESPHLVPISVEPDGTPAAQRIAEGTTWMLTNTISF